MSMVYSKFHIKIILPFLALLLLTTACGSTGSGSGTLSVGLTDGVNENYEAVYVTINDVQVHRKGEAEDSETGWLSLPDFDGPRTIDLLELRDGVVSGLGSIELESGSYTQIRLIIGTVPDAGSNIQCHPHPFANYVIDGDGNVFEMTVPSGEQTGIKVVCAGKCDINENQTTELILDFDAEQSVVVAGNSGNINLKPTIKVLSTEDFTLVTGQVVDAPDTDPEAAETPLSGAWVSAQVYDPAAADLKDEVKVVAHTQTDANGEYRLLLKPGEYNLVATQDGFAPDAVDLTTAAGQVLDQLLDLDPSATGEVAGTLSIGGITEPTFGTLSFREDASLSGEKIEVNSAEILDGSAYSVILPVDSTSDYQLVASTCNQVSQGTDITVVPDTVLDLDIIFP